MSIISQLTLNGLIAGSIYALVASGFSLIYATNRFMHFAHGSSVLLGGYLFLVFHKLLNIQFILAAILTILCTSLLGLSMYKCIYSPLQKKKASSVILLIASIGLLIFFQNGIQLLFGARVQTLTQTAQESISILGGNITPLQLTILTVAFILIFALEWLMKKTKLGVKMRATADNTELANIVGISHKRIASYSFLIGSALAGIAGILIGLEQNLFPTMGTHIMVKGFTGAVIGSIISVPGSIIGSFILGFAENYLSWYLPSSYKEAIAFVILFLFLLIRPNGLFGAHKDKEVKT